MKKRTTVVTLAVLALLIAAIALGTVTHAKKPGLKKCPWSDLNCLDVWDPVECDDGKIYSNACYALRACATGCSSTGGGPIF